MKKKSEKNKISKMIGKMAGVATFATGVITGETTVVKNASAAQKMNSTNEISISKKRKKNVKTKFINWYNSAKLSRKFSSDKWKISNRKS